MKKNALALPKSWSSSMIAKELPEEEMEIRGGVTKE
jgi:hypothetical protein